MQGATIVDQVVSITPAENYMPKVEACASLEIATKFYTFNL